MPACARKPWHPVFRLANETPCFAAISDQKTWHLKSCPKDPSIVFRNRLERLKLSNKTGRTHKRSAVTGLERIMIPCKRVSAVYSKFENSNWSGANSSRFPEPSPPRCFSRPATPAIG